MNNLNLSIYKFLSIINSIIAIIMYIFQLIIIRKYIVFELNFWLVEILILFILFIPVILLQLIRILSLKYKWNNVVNIICCIVLENFFISFFIIFGLALTIPIK